MLKTKLFPAFKAAFKHTIPVLTGFLFLGMAYGMLMQTKGYGLIWSLLASIIAFCGSMQYAAITLLTTAFNPFAALALSIMVNARHMFYGISMLHKYNGTGKIKPFLIFALCDETFSIVSSVEPPPEIKKQHFYFAVSFLDYMYWVLGTLLGAVLGSFVTFNTKGLDFVLTALFIVLFLNQWKDKENRPAAVIGVCATAICLILFGEANFIIPSMAIILTVLFLGRNKL